MNKKFLFPFLMALSMVMLPMTLTSCGGDDEEPSKPELPTPPSGDDEEEDDPLKPTPDNTDFARGADISWLTLAEANGEKFYDASMKEADCLDVLRNDCAVNSIRLRVWVDPEDGYCGEEDLLAKARRASAAGMRLMIDFHLADSWADPGKQPVPKAWTGMEPAAMAQAVADHVEHILTRLKDENIGVDWVQIGNETTSGMLWESGRVKDQDAGEFPRYLNAGYDAVKRVFPSALVIVHLDRGQDRATFQWFFDLINRYGARYDMIGMSLYPEMGTWPEKTDEAAINSCIANIPYLARRYSRPVMLCEFGMHYSRGKEAARVIKKILNGTSPADLRGLFYWEPQASPGFNGGYNKGAFENGRPTVALTSYPFWK